MTSDIAPLTPPDADLQDFPFMPLHVARLRDSAFALEETPETCWFAVMLWSAAWHQVPAGSLPADDRELKRLSGAGRRWSGISEAVLRGWVRCSDGRLYHPFIATLANRAWEAKQRVRRKIDRRLEITSERWAYLRSIVFERDDFTCRYCGARGGKLECDHVIPVARGGVTELHNLVTACRPCNRSKGARSLEEWSV